MDAKASTRVSKLTVSGIRALEHVAAINRTERNARSERGFNTAMRVNSDRPSKLVRLSDGSMPGITVAFQRIHADALTYAQRCSAAQELKRREGPRESVWSDIGSTFAPPKPETPVDKLARGASVREALGLGGL